MKEERGLSSLHGLLFQALVQTGWELPWPVCWTSWATTRETEEAAGASSQAFQWHFWVLVVFTCFSHCCWALSVFLHLTSPNSSLVHLPLLLQRLCRFLCQILTSLSMPLPIAHSFLYYKQNAFPRDRDRVDGGVVGWERGGTCSLYLFGFFPKNL